MSRSMRYGRVWRWQMAPRCYLLPWFHYAGYDTFYDNASREVIVDDYFGGWLIWQFWWRRIR